MTAKQFRNIQRSKLFTPEERKYREFLGKSFTEEYRRAGKEINAFGYKYLDEIKKEMAEKIALIFNLEDAEEFARRNFN